MVGKLSFFLASDLPLVGMGIFGADFLAQIFWRRIFWRQNVE